MLVANETGDELCKEKHAEQNRTRQNKKKQKTHMKTLLMLVNNEKLKNVIY